MELLSLTTLTDEQPARNPPAHAIRIAGVRPTPSTVATAARCTRKSWRWPKDTDSLRTARRLGSRRFTAARACRRHHWPGYPVNAP